MKTDIQHFKDILSKEMEVLEAELSTVGRKNPDQAGDWEAVEGDTNTNATEEGDIAEGIEEYENNKGILDQLEIRLREVKVAIEKIEVGKFGKCEICEKEIEEDRLGANPAAPTCILHMNP